MLAATWKRLILTASLRWEDTYSICISSSLSVSLSDFSKVSNSLLSPISESSWIWKIKVGSIVTKKRKITIALYLFQPFRWFCILEDATLPSFSLFSSFKSFLLLVLHLVSPLQHYGIFATKESALIALVLESRFFDDASLLLIFIFFYGPLISFRKFCPFTWDVEFILSIMRRSLLLIGFWMLIRSSLGTVMLETNDC